MPSLSLQNDAGAIARVGSADYASTYGGVSVSAHAINLYVVATSAAVAAASPLVRAASLAAAGGQLTVHSVEHSWQDLTTTAQTLASQYTTLANSGIQLSNFSPNPDDNSVDVRLANPTPANIARLNALYPGKLIVSTIPVSSKNRRTDRTTDYLPFYEGDPLGRSSSESLYCSASFFYTGKASGKIYGMTAGHCNSHTWYTNSSLYGSTSTIYFENDGIDVQSIKNSDSGWGLGYVWGNSGTYPVEGARQLVKGDTADFDGNIYGEVRNTPITQVDMCDNFGESTLTCYLDQGESPTGGGVCNGGDSGGPVIQHTSTSSVYALGPIVGLGEYEGEPSASICEYNEIDVVLDYANGTLLTE